MTHKSGGRSPQGSTFRRCDLKEIGECEVVTGESVARRHPRVECRMTLAVRERKIAKWGQRIK